MREMSEIHFFYERRIPMSRRAHGREVVIVANGHKQHQMQRDIEIERHTLPSLRPQTGTPRNTSDQ